MLLNENIEKIRKERNLTQQELAEKLNISYKIIYNWEIGSIIPCYEKLNELAKILNTTKEKLLDGDIKKQYMYTFIECNSKNLNRIANNKYSLYWDYIWGSAIEGKEAIKEFNKKKINDVYVFFDYNDIILERKNLNLLELLKIIDEVEYTDCYVVNKNFTWTFIMTHELECWNELKRYLNGECDMEYITSLGYYIGPFFKTINTKEKK